jgi:hypothetical protein
MIKIKAEGLLLMGQMEGEYVFSFISSVQHG